MPRISSLDVPQLPEGFVPVEVVAVIKCLDDQGAPTMAVRSSSGLMAWDAIGMLIAASDLYRADLQSELLGGVESEDQADGPDEED